jgi:hypothetical protein
MTEGDGSNWHYPGRKTPSADGTTLGCQLHKTNKTEQSGKRLEKDGGDGVETLLEQTPGEITRTRGAAFIYLFD